MFGKRRRSIGFHLRKGEVFALDPASGKTHRERIGQENGFPDRRGAMDSAYRALGKPAGHLQVAFSDDLLLFAAWPMEEAPRKRAEIERLARWRLTKITGNVQAYELGCQVVRHAAGRVLMVTAVPAELMNTMREFVRDKPLRWTVADSTASFVFNHLKPELKKDPGALLLELETCWTFLSWGPGAAVELVKTGPLAADDGMREAAGEVTRLMHSSGRADSERTRSVGVWRAGERQGEIPQQADPVFEPVKSVFHPGIMGRPSDVGHLMAELASYTR